MRIRLTLIAIVAMASVAWIAIDHGLLAGGRAAQPLQAPAASAALPLQTDAEPSTVPTATSDHATPSTTTAVAPTSADAASTAAQPSPASELAESSGSRLAALERRARSGDRKAARDWVDAIVQCASAMYGQHIAPRPTHLSYLDSNLFEPQHAMRLELLAGLIDECGMMFPPADREQAMLHAQQLIVEAIRLWAASGDPLGRLAQSQFESSWPPPLEQWRQQQAWAAAHLNAADPQTLIDLAGSFTYTSRFNSGTAWRLAACDLGYDCAAGGALARQLCLNEMQCFAGSYEEELLQRLPPRQWQIAQAQRSALVEMLRRGEVTTIFDVPPPGP